jgi:glyoxylase-like metal-dependent hydrolase (beta-lactamase superfamily II)
MQRDTIAVGSFEVNTSIILVNDDLYIVDPGAEVERIISRIENIGKVPKAVLLTHAHFDHIGAVEGLQLKYKDLPVCVSVEEREVITHPFNQYPPEYPAVNLFRNIVEPSQFLDCAEVIPTPGHTPGGVCYYFKEDKILFSGDTLFRQSIGRTDLPGGDMSLLMKSLSTLMCLPEETLVVPGHGMETTVGFEKTHNPFLNILI